MTLSDRAMTFGEVAEEYHRWRPFYPPAVVDWLAPAAPARVADVGAGSGKLTELRCARDAGDALRQVASCIRWTPKA